MAHSYTAHFRVRHYELDAHDEMPSRALAHLFQETAMCASTSEGYDIAWYDAHHTVWVIREMTLVHVRPIHYQDELTVTTWLSEMQRVRAYREYLARNVTTGEVVACGRAYWAYLDRTTLFPTRIPADVIEQFAPNGVRAVAKKPRSYPPPSTGQLPVEIRAQRRVQHYEADSMQHVNNGIYLDWLQEPLAEMTLPSMRLCVRRHDVEYLRGALPGEQVEIVTRLVGAGHCATAWVQEITRAGELVVRNHMTALWLDPAGRPVRYSELPLNGDSPQ